MTKIEIVKTETSKGNQIRVNRFLAAHPNAKVASSYAAPITTRSGKPALRFYTVLKYTA